MRNNKLASLPHQVDLVVIGGDINGTAIAADAAGRGLSVLLCDPGDLASCAAQHGGKSFLGDVRHLEHLDIGLVRKSLHERKLLARRAPHLLQVLDCVIPCGHFSRPLWKLKGILFLYEWLGNRELSHFKITRAIESSVGHLYRSHVDQVVCYQDVLIDQLRLTISQALLAKAKGATIANYTRCTAAQRTRQGWALTFCQTEPNITTTPDANGTQVQARAVINAAGSCASEIHHLLTGTDARCQPSLVRISSILTPRFLEGSESHLLQHEDGQIISVCPISDDHTLIGYSQQAVSDTYAQAHPAMASPDDQQYLIDAVNGYMKASLSIDDIIMSFSHFKCQSPMGASGSDPDPDCLLELTCTDGHSPLVTVFEGGIATPRVTAEQTLELLAPYLGHIGKRWTAMAPLPGADMQGQDAIKWSLQTKQRYPALPEKLIDRLIATYGSTALDILTDSDTVVSLGEHFGHTLYEKECQYLIDHEWARSAEDILMRRTHLIQVSQEIDLPSLQRWCEGYMSR